MAHTFRGFSRAGRSSPPRKAAWEVGPGGGAIQVLTASGSSVIGAGALALEDGLTMVRLRGHVTLYLRLGGINDAFFGAMGIGVYTAAAFAIGVTAMETPITDEAWNGWLWHQYFGLGTPVAITSSSNESAGATAGVGMLQLDIDSKAMRKLHTEDVIAMVIEVTEVGTSELAIVGMSSRVLIKLP